MKPIKSQRPFMTKGRVLYIGVLALFGAMCSQAAIISVETFDYPNGFIGGKNGGLLWDYSNNTVSPTHTSTASDWNTLVSSPLISDSQLITDGSSAKREYNGPGEGSTAPSDERDGAVHSSSDATVVYHRVTFTTGSVVPDEILISSLDFGPARVSFGKHTGSSVLGLKILSPFSASGTSAIFVSPNTTYTLVTKIDYAGDKAELFVNPDFNQSEPSPSLSLTYTGTHWSTAVSLFSSSGGSVIWDDLVVTTTWDELGTVVTTSNDEDNGSLAAVGSGISLREAVNHSPSGSLITFDPDLAGRMITLDSSQLSITKNLAIDASALALPLTISGDDSYRIFNVAVNTTVSMQHLRLIRGRDSGSGGAIYTEGNLTLTDCTIRDSIASAHGGGIYNTGTANLTLNRCTLTGNTGLTGSGGGLVNDGIFTLNHCTLTGNRSSSAGAILNDAQKNGGIGVGTLNACTIIENFSTHSDGGGIYNKGNLSSTPILTLSDCIVSKNETFDEGPDIYNRRGTVISLNSNLIGDTADSSLTNGVDGVLEIADPLLAPLNHYGGPTPTMPPLFGSPAISAGVNFNPGSTDQRGFSRLNGGVLDLGAVESGTFLFVNTMADENGTGSDLSLREAVAAASTPGTFIQFSTNVFTGANTIELTHGQISIPSPKGVTIYAGNLSKGVTISGDGTDRIFYIGSTNTASRGTSATLHGLNLVNGYATAAYPFDQGGAIYNQYNALYLQACTLSENYASRYGGGIYNHGSFSGAASLTLQSCTLTRNVGQFRAGAINNAGRLGHVLLNIDACTFSGNKGNFGGAIYNDGGSGVASLNLSSSIFEQNEATQGEDIRNISGTVNSIGDNFLGNVTDSTLTDGVDGVIEVADPLIAPLGNYGGLTPTMPPLYGSPAIDAGSNIDFRDTDQRGFPRFVGTHQDLGAVESSAFLLVNTTADENDGTATGDISLRDAVGAAVNNGMPGTIIQFDPTTYFGLETIRLQHGQIEIPSPQGLTIYAGNQIHGVTVEGDGTSRIFYIGSTNTPTQPTSAALHGLTLTHGREDIGAGGAIYNQHNALYLTACTLSANSATNGGAIYNDGTTESAGLSLNTCTLSGNSAMNGGGIYNNALSGRAFLSLKDCTLSGNTADFGGGILNDGPSSTSLLLAFSVVAQNSAPSGPDIVNIAGKVKTFGFNLVGNLEFSSLTNGVAGVLEAADPMLAPLGNYGGPTQTMPPLSGSPAINFGTIVDFGGTDQRGFPRFAGGERDLGATESGAFLMVNTLLDENDGLLVNDVSLRDAVAAATISGAPGIFIQFDPTIFNGANILPLAHGQIDMVSPQGLTLFAADIPTGITIDAGESSRIFYIGSTNTAVPPGSATFFHFSLINGEASGGGQGGAIYNQHNALTLNACTLSENDAFEGGGICNNGIKGNASLSLNACTLSGNTATLGGGAISNAGQQGNAPVSLHACTLSGNTTLYGGGIYNAGATGNAPILLRASLIGQNEASDGGPDLWNADGTIISIGNNLIGDHSGFSLLSGSVIVTSNLYLAPLGNYGGPTQTMPPLPGSPAIDAGGSSSLVTDQRGLPRMFNNSIDLGAVEIQGQSDFDSIVISAWNTDEDGDGNPFGLEFTLGTDWTVADPENPLNLSMSQGTVSFGYNNNAFGHTSWVLTRSLDLTSDPFVEIFRYDGALNPYITNNVPLEISHAGNTLHLTDESGVTNAYYRFEARMNL